MRKIIVLLLIIAVIIFIAFITNIPNKLHSISSEDIYTEIEAGEMQLDLAALANSGWDSVHVFGPYTTDEMIEDSTGIQFRFHGIDVKESEFLLVFANKKKPIKSIYLSRTYGDYKIAENRFLVIEDNS